MITAKCQHELIEVGVTHPAKSSTNKTFLINLQDTIPTLEIPN